MNALLKAVLVAAVAGLALGGGVVAIAKLRPKRQPAAHAQVQAQTQAPPRADAEAPQGYAAPPRGGHLDAGEDAAEAFIGARLPTFGTDGGRIADVLPGSPAAAAGLRAGDVITHVDGRPLRELLTLKEIARFSGVHALHGAPGSEVVLRIAGRGDTRVRRTIPRQDASAAWKRFAAVEEARVLKEAAAADPKLAAELKRVKAAIGKPPGWVDGAWQGHADRARATLARIQAPALAKLAAALKARSDREVVAHMLPFGDVMVACAPFMDRERGAGALPLELRGAFQLSALREAYRRAAAGDLDGGARLAEQAERATTDGESESVTSADDPRYAAAGQAAGTAIARARSAASALEEARKRHAELRQAAQQDGMSYGELLVGVF